MESTSIADSSIYLFIHIYKIVTSYQFLLVTCLLFILNKIFFTKSKVYKFEDFEFRPPVPVDEPYTGEESPALDSYSPEISGWFWSTIVRRLHNTYLKDWVMSYVLRKTGRIQLLDKIIFPEFPTYHPMIEGERFLYEREPINNKDIWNMTMESSDEDGNGGFQFISISDLLSVYRNGKKTPEEVMKNLIHCLKEADRQTPSLRAVIEYHEDLIMEQASASTRRWNEGEPLSVFDGIPVGVKDEFIVGGHHSRQGLPFDDVEKEDISSELGIVKKLREGGAIIIGMTNTHQLGLGITGINTSKYHGTCRNPYNPRYTPGGSSSGSASAVAAGLSVITVGGDMGGSIRIPSGCCGIVGLKSTFGRCSGAGYKEIGDSVLVHNGTLCSSVRDAAISYGFVAGKDENFPIGMTQPPVYLGDFDSLDLSGIKVGVDRAWNEESLPELQLGCSNVLNWLKEKYNVEVVNIHIPEKNESSVAHMCLACGEVGAANILLCDDGANKLELDTLLAMEIGKNIDAHNYVQACIQKTRSINTFKYIFSKVDVILTPGFHLFQPEMNQAYLKYGFSSLKYMSKIIRYNQLGNFIGIPGMTMPVGYTKTNLPVPVQLMSSWWREDIILKVGYAIERCVKKRAPQVYFDILH